MNERTDLERTDLERTDLERTVAAWLAAEAPTSIPDDLLGPVLATTGGRRPWPTWRALLTVPPMRTHARDLVGSPTWRAAGILTALLLLAGLLLVGALAGSGAQRLVDRLPAESPIERPTNGPEPSPVELGDPPRFVVDLAVDPTVTWTGGSSQYPASDTQDYTAWHGSRPDSDGFIANLIVTRPSTVYEPTGSVPVPEDLVAWMSEHPALSVGDIVSRSLGGVPAVAFGATAATRYMEPPRRTFVLFPGFLIDGGWSYLVTAVDLGQQGWLVAICESQGWQDADLPEEDAVAACEKLLGTFRFVDPVPPRPAGGDLFAPGRRPPPLAGSRLVLDGSGQLVPGGGFDVDQHRGRPTVVLSARSVWPGRLDGDPAFDVRAAVANLARLRAATGDDATFVVIAWPAFVDGYRLDRWRMAWEDILQAAADSAGPAAQDVIVIDGDSLLLENMDWDEGWTALDGPHASRGAISYTSLVILDGEGRVSQTFLEPLPSFEELATLLEALR